MFYQLYKIKQLKQMVHKYVRWGQRETDLTNFYFYFLKYTYTSMVHSQVQKYLDNDKLFCFCQIKNSSCE